MDLNGLLNLVEELRREAIGEPNWVEEKQVFEYPDQSARTVAVLKLIRAAQGISALSVLCIEGLFIDFGAAFRCVSDATEEVYFLLEEFPKASGNVDKFVKSFFENTIDGYLDAAALPVTRDKIRSATVRLLKGGQDENTRQLMERIYKTFCGYTHANYAHIMEVYGGPSHDFNLRGVPSVHERARRKIQISLAKDEVFHCAAFVAQRLELSQAQGVISKILRPEQPSSSENVR